MPEINYNQFKKITSQFDISNLYLLTGDSDLVSYCEKKIISLALGKHYTDFDLLTLKDEDFSNQKLQLALDTFPITANKKCVVLKEIPWEYFNEEEFKEFIKIISDIPSFAVLIITQISPIMGAKNSSRFSKVKKFITQNGIYLKLSQSDLPLERQLISWVKREYNKILEEPESKKIIKLCQGYQLHEIKNELKKVCEFESSKIITNESLKIIWNSEIKVNAFELSKSLFDGNIKKCFEILDKLFSQGEEPFRIISAISLDFIDLHRITILIENNHSPSELTTLFDYKGKEFRIKTAQYRYKKLSKKNIEECLKLLLDSDVKLKSTAISPEVIISELIVLISEKLYPKWN